VIATNTTLQSQLTVTFTPEETVSGDVVDVDVSVTGFTDVVSMQFSINWDSTVYKFNSIQNVTEVLEEFSEAGNIGVPPGAAAIDEGEATVSWNRMDTEARTLPSDTRLFTLRLSIAGEECDFSRVILSSTPRTIEVADNSFMDVGARASNPFVQIDGSNCEAPADDGNGMTDTTTGGGTGGGGTGGGGTGGGGTDGGGTGGGGTDGGGTGGGGTDGGGSGSFPDCPNNCDGSADVTFVVNCVPADPNTNVCVPVSANNFTSLASFQAGITWDQNQLSYTELKEGAISGITPNAAMADQGSMRLLWIIGISDDPVTLDDRTTLFELCFDVTGTDGESPMVTLEDLPGFSVEVSDAQANTLNYCSQEAQEEELPEALIMYAKIQTTQVLLFKEALLKQVQISVYQ